MGKTDGPTLNDMAKGEGGLIKPMVEDGRTHFRLAYRRRPSEPAQEGVFHIRVPSLQDDAEIARMKVVFSGGLAWQCIDPRDQALFESMAVCQVLVEQPLPPFFDMPINKIDKSLIFAVAAKVRQWEIDFFRGGPGTGDNEQSKPRVEILPEVGE